MSVIDGQTDRLAHSICRASLRCTAKNRLRLLSARCFDTVEMFRSPLSVCLFVCKMKTSESLHVESSFLSAGTHLQTLQIKLVLGVSAPREYNRRRSPSPAMEIWGCHSRKIFETLKAKCCFLGSENGVQRKGANVVSLSH